MKHRNLYSLLVYMCLSLIPVFCDAAAILSVDRREIDIGSIPQGEKVEQVFHFSNRGDTPLVIDQVKPSCGCTVAALSSSRVAPGAKGEIRTVFDSSRFSGEIHKSIYVTSNDPQQPTIELILRGFVTPEVVVSPARIDFGTVKVGQSRNFNIEINNRGAIPLTIKSIEILVQAVEVTAKERVVPPRGKVEMQLILKPHPGVARISGYLIIQTDSLRSPELRVPVYGIIAEAHTPPR